MTIAAVVPLFNPDGEVFRRLEALARQVDHLVLVDDGSSTPFALPAGVLPDALVIRQANLGIASALNAGVVTARTLWPSVAFVITVDQDSTLASDYVRKALRALESARADGVPVGAICAEQFNEWRVSPSGENSGHRTALQVAQSGLVLTTETLERFGPFSDELFIDCVDTEYVLRMLAAGTVVVVGEGCRLDHQVGEMVDLTVRGKQVRIGGRIRRVSIHTATRRYYITRNRVAVYPRFAKTAPKWLLRDTLLEAKTTLLSIAFGPAKKQQALAVLLGAIDGGQKKLGPISPRRRATLSGSRR